MEFLEPIEFRLPLSAAAAAGETSVVKEFGLSAMALIVCHRRRCDWITRWATTLHTPLLAAKLLFNGQAQVI